MLHAHVISCPDHVDAHFDEPLGGSQMISEWNIENGLGQIRVLGEIDHHLL